MDRAADGEIPAQTAESAAFFQLVQRRERGKLKVYVGSAAGVGKTYRMLSEAHALKARGVDVVIGFIEPHGRAETDKTALLEAGADDYVTKPFGTAELRARVQAQLRRARMAPLPGDEGPITIGELVVDTARRTVTRAGESVHLTPTEWNLLRVLIANAGRPVTHARLFHEVWGDVAGDAQQYLRVYVGHLRRKLERDPYRPRMILTEPGVGYRLVPESETDDAA